MLLTPILQAEMPVIGIVNRTPNAMLQTRKPSRRPRISADSEGPGQQHSAADVCAFSVMHVGRAAQHVAAQSSAI